MTVRNNSNAVAVANSSSNETINDVIGNRTDAFGTTTLAGGIHEIREHVHSAQLVWPYLADPVTVMGSAEAWTLGAAATVCNAGIATAFDIHHVDVSAASANEEYMLVLYDDGVIVCEVSFTKSPTSDPVRSMPVVCPLIAADSIITAKLATKGGGSDTCAVKFWYHTYS